MVYYIGEEGRTRLFNERANDDFDPFDFDEEDLIQMQKFLQTSEIALGEDGELGNLSLINKETGQYIHPFAEIIAEEVKSSLCENGIEPYEPD